MRFNPKRCFRAGCSYAGAVCLVLLLAANALAAQKATAPQLPPDMDARARAVCGKADTFDCYTNHKYGFLLAWPTKLLKAEGESDAGDGQVFTAGDGRASLTCWASMEGGAKRALPRLFREAQDAPGLQVTYKHQGQDFFVVSGMQDGKVVYRKTVVTEDVQASFQLEYDQALKTTFDPLVGDIARSFMVHPAFAWQ